MAAQAESSGKPQKPKSRIPTAASSWDEETLNLLNAKFLMNAETHEGKITEFPPERPFGIDVQFKLPENAQKSTLHSLTLLKVVIDQIAEELRKVNNGNTIHPRYEFDIDHHPSIQLFVHFYRQLDQSLLRVEKRKLNQDPVSTSDRPSSGDATLEKVSDNIANHFLSASFEHSRVGKHFWWATQHNSPMILRHEGYTRLRIP